MKLYYAPGVCSLEAHIVLPVCIACADYAFEARPKVREARMAEGLPEAAAI